MTLVVIYCVYFNCVLLSFSYIFTCIWLIYDTVFPLRWTILVNQKPKKKLTSHVGGRHVATGVSNSTFCTRFEANSTATALGLPRLCGLQKVYADRTSCAVIW